MPNVLLISTNQLFAHDLSEQISLYAKDFSLIDDQNVDAIADIVIVDEDVSLLDDLHKRYLKAPIFLLSSAVDDGTPKPPYAQIINKPFSLDIFFDELNSCLNFYENSSKGYLVFNQYIVRPAKKSILNQRNNELIKLTEKEVAILKYLYKAQDKTVSKNELLQEVWGYSPDVSTHTVETHVYRLRQKVEHEDESAQLIITLDGGYQLKV